MIGEPEGGHNPQVLRRRFGISSRRRTPRGGGRTKDAGVVRGRSSSVLVLPMEQRRCRQGEKGHFPSASQSMPV